MPQATPQSSPEVEATEAPTLQLGIRPLDFRERHRTRRRRTETKYPYEDLKSGNWIRILHLYAADQQDDPLLARLENVDLNEHAVAKSGHTNGSTTHDRRSRRPPHAYEAISWCWGKESQTELLTLQDPISGKRWRMKIPPNLAQALRHLRFYNKQDPRLLWADAICINMENEQERAHQVAQMNLVYGSAFNVCVWLDDQLQTTLRYGMSVKETFTFLDKEMLDLAKFDATIESRANARRWLAFLQVMTKQWFSRRWVIQEIALARKATIHCGDATIKWERFAHAVALFVKAESANNQLSDIVRRDETLDHKPGVFRDIDRMGAALLVQMTNTNFSGVASGTARPVSDLETLMSMLPMFECSNCCDTIYALLAIAKDTRPEAEGNQQKIVEFRNIWKLIKQFKNDEEAMLRKLDKARKVAEMLASNLRSKTYIVSYSKKPIDVYQYFIEFCIYQSRSLDIICRPWAPKPETMAGKSKLTRSDTDTIAESVSSSSESDDADSSGADYSDSPSDDDDDLVSMQTRARVETMFSQYSLDDAKSPPLMQEDGVTDSEYQSEIPLHENRSPPRVPRRISRPQRPAPPLPKTSTQSHGKMPSWIADRQNAAFKLSAEEPMPLMERTNPDPLVGSPDDKPYRASGRREVRLGKVKFLRRDEYDQSLFVEGFVLDQIAETQEPAMLSNISHNWFDFVKFGNDSTKKKPPEDFYRTLIADRGLNGTKPPPYFSLAYSEVLKRDRSTTLDIRPVINEGKSIVSEFLDRVRQVIFGRRLMKTATAMKVERDGKAKQRLGLVPRDTRSMKADRQGGDLICILYGLSVPVVLRKHVKTREEKIADREARERDLPEAYQKAVRIIETHWSFRKELEKTLYYMDESEVKGRFSKLWLDKIRSDFEARIKEAEAKAKEHDAIPPAVAEEDGILTGTTTPTDSRAEKPERLKPNRTPEDQQRLWTEMCEEWKEMIKHGDYKYRKEGVEDREITVLLKEGDDEYYEVIGEAYVDQMMDGQALAYKQEQRIPDQVFELR